MAPIGAQVETAGPSGARFRDAGLLPDPPAGRLCRAGTARGGDADPARSRPAPARHCSASARPAGSARASDCAARREPSITREGCLTSRERCALTAGRASSDSGAKAAEAGPDRRGVPAAMGKQCFSSRMKRTSPRRSASSLLRDGWQVTHLADGRRRCRRAAARLMPDLVILDQMLPGATGLEILADLRADPITAKLPVLMLTAKGQPRDREAAERAGRQPLHGQALCQCRDPGRGARHDRHRGPRAARRTAWEWPGQG